MKVIYGFLCLLLIFDVAAMVCEENVHPRSYCSFSDLAATEYQCAKLNEAFHAQLQTRPKCNRNSRRWTCAASSEISTTDELNAGLSWGKNIAPEKISSTMRGPGVKLFWWNIEGINTFNPKKFESHKCQTLNLNFNLIKFLQIPEYAPDIIALGEFSWDMLDVQTKQIISEKYPYQIIENYNSYYNGFGIGVFSRYPLRLKRKEILDWAPAHYTEDEKNHYRANVSDAFPLALVNFEKIYLNIEVQTPHENFSLIPIHLNMPWSMIKENLKHEARIFNLILLGISTQR